MKSVKLMQYIAPPNADCSVQLDGQIISATQKNGTEGVAWYGFKLFNIGKRPKRITLSATKNTLKFTISTIKEEKKK